MQNTRKDKGNGRCVWTESTLAFKREWLSFWQAVILVILIQVISGSIEKLTAVVTCIKLSIRRLKFFVLLKLFIRAKQFNFC